MNQDLELGEIRLNTTFTRKPGFLNGGNNQKWFLVDADGQTLGRIASHVALFCAVSNTEFTPRSTDLGDFVGDC